jgi:hypothetical protein
MVDFSQVDLSAGSVSGATLVVEDRVLSGAIVDVDDNPVQDAEVRWMQDVSYLQGAAQGHAAYNTRSDAAGRFTMRVLPGRGDLETLPVENGGLVPFTIHGLEIRGDQNLVVVVQFVPDGASAIVGAGA